MYPVFGNLLTLLERVILAKQVRLRLASRLMHFIQLRVNLSSFTQACGKSSVKLRFLDQESDEVFQACHLPVFEVIIIPLVYRYCLKSVMSFSNMLLFPVFGHCISVWILHELQEILSLINPFEVGCCEV